MNSSQSDELTPNEIPADPLWGNDEEMGFLKLARTAYGSMMRKGIPKPAFAHCADVMSECELEHTGSIAKGISIYQIAILHDILEDFPVTPERLKRKADLDDHEIHVLKLLSRNYDVYPGLSYIEQIMKDEDAIHVKFADRIANIKDLLLWVEEEEGFTRESAAMARKYLKETRQMLDLYRKSYENQEALSGSPLPFMEKKLAEQLERLEQAYRLNPPREKE